MDIKNGKYRHYKGGIYEVFGVGIHSETFEKMVLYKNKDGEIWIRPLSMFVENVVKDGVEQKRFEYIG